ncbi:Gfo/Idh/MocA family oxidoreductase [bacterium LRH843]|nr:Gfo/Idh/MocA family oxidoreductase [bacterium LRH843]
MRNIRFGVVSTANIAQTQLIPAIRRAKYAELVGIASSSEKVKEIAAACSIPKVYGSYEALLQDPDIDAVYIPLPNHLHKRWVLEAAKAGKHVLCEKPAALTAEEASEMVTACRDNQVIFMEAFMYQFHPQHERVKEIISSGEVGDIRLIRSSHSFFLEDRETNIRMNNTMGGGSLYDVGCYSVHSIRHILQSEPVEVFVQAEIDPTSGVDVSAYGLLSLENGVKAMFDCSFDMVGRNEYEIVGTRGTIHVPYAYRPDLINGNVGIVSITIGNKTREEKIQGDAYALQVEHFSKAILNDEQPSQTGANTIQNMRVIDACYESINTGKTISIQ